MDYEFQDFPDEISLSSSSPRALRENLELWTDRQPAEMYYGLTAAVDEEVALGYLTRAVTLMPENEPALFLLANVAPVEDFTELATPRLAARPLDVEWHRAYQDALGRSGRSQEVIDEYQSMLRAEPDDSRALYLASRVGLDPERSESLLRRAIELDPSNAWAFNSLAYHKLVSGELSEALPLVRQARQLMPEKPGFQAFEVEIVLANRRYRELLDQNLEQQEERPLDGSLVTQEILLRSASGQREQAAACVDDFIERLGGVAANDRRWEDPTQWRLFLEAMVTYGRGDLEAFGTQIGQIGGPWNAFEAALAGGAMSAADEALTESGQLTADNHLLIYLGASRAGQADLADRHLRSAIELLGQGLPAQRALAQGLAGEAPAGLDFLRLAFDPSSKAVTLAALALRDPARGLAYRRLATKLNFQLGFPRLYLERMLSG